MGSYIESMCHGTHSIQNEINKIIKDTGPGWEAKIKSTTFREAVRAKLRASRPDVVWCDYRAKECACE